MAVASIHVGPDDSFDDCVVRNDKGHEFDHYPTREEAELAAQPIGRAPPRWTNELHQFYKELDRQIVRNLI
jgi:hypothetical protein